MKGPMPRNWQELYWAMTPVVLNWCGIMEDIGKAPDYECLHLWEALSYQCKAMAARIDKLVEEERNARTS